MEGNLSRRLVPDRFWKLAAPLIPEFSPRRQGGGTGALDDRYVFTAVVFVLASECSWRGVLSSLEVSPATAHRRFTAWTRAGLWERLRQAAEAKGERDHDLEWVSVIVDAAISRGGHADCPSMGAAGRRHGAIGHGSR